MADRPSVEPFSEKGFYLNEFRGRTLAIAARAEDLRRPASLEALLTELEANTTRVVLLSTEKPALEALLGAAALAASEPRFEGEVWRALSRAPHVGVACDQGRESAA